MNNSTQYSKKVRSKIHNLVSNYLRSDEIVVGLENRRYINYIKSVINSTIETNWLETLSENTQITDLGVMDKFLSWLQEEFLSINFNTIIKDYEEFRISNGIKPQSTGANTIILVFKIGLSTGIHDKKTFIYINNLILSTKLSKNEERNPGTLTQFFSQISWLKDHIDEKDWYKLESPKRLTSSFSITISTMLEMVLDYKFEAMKRRNEILSIMKTNKTRKIKRNKRTKRNKKNEKIAEKRQRYTHYSRDILNLLYKKDTKDPKDYVFNAILLMDTTLPEFQSYAVELLANNSFLPTKPSIEGSSSNKQMFTKPILLDFENPVLIGKFEQTLFTWLCAYLTVQSTDIHHLNKKNFITKKHNLTGSIKFIQCVYYKSRSGCIQQTRIIRSSSIMGKSLLKYLDYFSDTEPLVSESTPVKIPLSFRDDNLIPSFIYKILSCQITSKIILSELEANKTSKIFINSYLSMSNNYITSFNSWRNYAKKNQTNSSYEHYLLSSKKPIPQRLFSLSDIKTSSIHAKSDIYRDSDLINYNSHTSATEKVSYLTNSNKDWINQNGRITRMVISDLILEEFNINYNKINSLTLDLYSKTQLKNKSKSYKPNSVAVTGEYSEPSSLSDFDNIVIIDSIETVISFLHYIDCSKKYKEILILENINFYESTVAPYCEWMSICLINLSPTNVKNGQLKYTKIKEHLPNIFEGNLL